MKSLELEMLALLNQSVQAVEAAFRRNTDAARLSLSFAEALRSLWPSAVLSACLLRGKEHPCVAVLDDSGSARPELEDLIRKEWSATGPPACMALSGHRLLVETSTGDEQGMVALALSVPGDGPLAAEPLVRSMLATCCGLAAPRFALLARQRELDQMRERLAEESTLAMIGELAGPVTHEFNNLLNTMLLQVAVMEQKVDETILPDLAAIRRQAITVTALVKQWQQYRRRSLSPDRTIDVNALIESAAIVALRLRSGEQQPLRLELTPHMPRVRGSEADFCRLLTFLLNNAMAVSAGAAVLVRSEAVGEKVFVHVEDAGPAATPATLARMFEPIGDGRPGTNRLELAACRTLVRRSQGKLHAESRPSGGVRVVVELPAQKG